MTVAFAPAKNVKWPADGWIHGPKRDLALMAAWIPFAAAAFFAGSNTTTLSLVVGTTLLISLAHQPLTLGLIYGDPAQFANAKRTFTFAPFLFIAAIIIGQHISLTLVGIVAGLWNAEHTLMQRYGVVRIYGRKSGETDRTDEKAMLFSWLVFALVWGGADSRTPHLLTRVDLGATNEAGVTFLQSLQPFARVALVPAFGWVAYSAWKWRRTEHALAPTVGDRSRLQKRLYLGLTLMLFAVMIWNPIVGLVGYVGAHAVEYIVIVHSALRKRYAGPTGETGGLVGRAVRTPLRATGCVIVYLVVVATFLRMVQTHATPTLANVVLLTIGGMHVFFDGFIWKLRRPVVAKSLL